METVVIALLRGIATDYDELLGPTASTAGTSRGERPSASVGDAPAALSQCTLHRQHKPLAS